MAKLVCIAQRSKDRRFTRLWYPFASDPDWPIGWELNRDGQTLEVKAKRMTNGEATYDLWAVAVVPSIPCYLTDDVRYNSRFMPGVSQEARDFVRRANADGRGEQDTIYMTTNEKLYENYGSATAESSGSVGGPVALRGGDISGSTGGAITLRAGNGSASAEGYAVLGGTPASVGAIRFDPSVPSPVIALPESTKPPMTPDEKKPMPRRKFRL